MAIFIPGMRCRLCELPMTGTDERVSFAHIVNNRADPLLFFSDGTFHAACFARHPLSEEMSRWHEEVLRRCKPTARICVVCGELILHPDDYFGTNLLARDAADPLHEFNFIHLHRRHAHDWGRLEELRRLLETARASGTWQGPSVVFEPRSPGGVRWVAD